MQRDLVNYQCGCSDGCKCEKCQCANTDSSCKCSAKGCPGCGESCSCEDSNGSCCGKDTCTCKH